MNTFTSLSFLMILSLAAASCSTSRMARVHGLTEEPTATVAASGAETSAPADEALAFARAVSDEEMESNTAEAAQAEETVTENPAPTKVAAVPAVPEQAPISHAQEESPMAFNTPVVETGPVSEPEPAPATAPTAVAAAPAPAKEPEPESVSEKIAASEFNPTTYFSLFTTPEGESKDDPKPEEKKVEVNKVTNGQ